MTTATRPASRHEQALSALALANEVRLKRCALKREVFAGKVDAASILATIPPEAETMSVGELLRSQNRWGEKRAHRLCVVLCISESRQLGRLTDRQRKLIAGAL